MEILLMIASLILSLLGRTAPSWLTKPVGYLIDAAIVLAVLTCVYFAIHHSGETAGAAKVTAKVEAAHTTAMVDVRHDEHAAQTVADQIGVSTAHTNALATEYVRTTIEDMHHAIDAAPAPAGAAPAVVDAAGLSAPLDALVDRANGAADAADAQS